MSDDTDTMTPFVAPFPYFGGKRRAAATVWAALGDVGGYVEPFAGSAAVLLARPPFLGRRVETLNDADGWLVNTWRAIREAPREVAWFAGGPVTEVDYHARLAWLQDRRTAGLVSWLEGDPHAYDAKAAGWWLYVMAAGIADPFGAGPWQVVDGRLTDVRTLPVDGAGRGVNRELPHLGNAGRGVSRDTGPGTLAAYLERLATRLARVRITCGDWTRVTTPSVVRVTAGQPGVGVFLDPPYSTSPDLYAHRDDEAVAARVREWAGANGTAYRIVLAGYDDEHDALLERGWTRARGRAGRGSGYSTNAKAGHRERLWLSPTCVGDDLFTAAGQAVNW